MEKLVKLFIVLAIFVCIHFRRVTSEVVNVSKCDSIGSLGTVDINDCHSLPCMLEKGENYTMSVQLIPKGDCYNLTIEAVAKVLGANIPIFSGDACEHLSDGKSCPLTDGVQYGFKLGVKISHLFPTFSTKVTAIVKDDKGNVQACGRLPVHIVNSKKSFH